MLTQEETRKRIEKAAQKLGLHALRLMKEYGVTTALAEMLEEQIRLEGDRQRQKE